MLWFMFVTQAKSRAMTMTKLAKRGWLRTPNVLEIYPRHTPTAHLRWDLEHNKAEQECPPSSKKPKYIIPDDKSLLRTSTLKLRPQKLSITQIWRLHNRHCNRHCASTGNDRRKITERLFYSLNKSSTMNRFEEIETVSASSQLVPTFQWSISLNIHKIFCKILYQQHFLPP